MEEPKKTKPKKTKSKNDTWATPIEVFNTLNSEFDFEFDVCAQHSTAKCPQYWTIDDDALSKDWTDDTVGALSLWCNPPYSKITPWVEKAIHAQSKGTKVVMLVMGATSVKWFSKALEYCSEVRYVINGRLSFVNNGVVQKGNNKPSVIFVFDPYHIKACKTKYVSRSTFY